MLVSGEEGLDRYIYRLCQLMSLHVYDLKLHFTILMYSLIWLHAYVANMVDTGEEHV